MEEMEGSYVLGLDYLKTELQSFIRGPRVFSSKADSSLLDELQCGASLASSCPPTRSEQTLLPGSGPRATDNRPHTEKNQPENQKNHRNLRRSYISRFVDDVENGNVEQGFRGRDEDDELLREESSVFTKRGDAIREESYLLPRTDGPHSPELRPFVHKRSSSLVGQLKGELPCHSPAPPSPPSLSPVEDHRSHDALQDRRKAITIQEKFKFSSFVMEQAKRQVREVESSPPRRRQSGHAPCCSHAPLRPPGVDEGQKENVHDFVMEIIDMTSTALRGKGQPQDPVQDQGPAPVAQIRDKVPSRCRQL